MRLRHNNSDCKGIVITRTPRFSIQIIEYDLKDHTLSPVVLNVESDMSNGEVVFYCTGCGRKDLTEDDLSLECWNCGKITPLSELVDIRKSHTGPLCPTCAKKITKAGANDAHAPIQIKFD